MKVPFVIHKPFDFWCQTECQIAFWFTEILPKREFINNCDIKWKPWWRIFLVIFGERQFSFDLTYQVEFEFSCLRASLSLCFLFNWTLAHTHTHARKKSQKKKAKKTPWTKFVQSRKGTFVAIHVQVVLHNDKNQIHFARHYCCRKSQSWRKDRDL